MQPEMENPRLKILLTSNTDISMKRWQRNSKGYTYVFEVQLSNKNSGILAAIFDFHLPSSSRLVVQCISTIPIE